MVVIGLGSPFLSDDSVGPRVVRALAGHRLNGVRLVEAHAGGLLLLEELSGAKRAVIVDALLDEQRAAGDVVVADIHTDSRNMTCSHDCSLPDALRIGRAMGMSLPDDVAIQLVGIVAQDVSTFSEDLTPCVAAAVQTACDTICALLSLDNNSPCAEAV
jgi:hydrogenase maturation protease